MYQRLNSLDAFAATAPAPAPVRRPERHLVLGELAGEFTPSSRWTAAPDLRHLMRLARQIKAGNIVLPYGRGTGFRSLARLVAALRAIDNPALRVLVREQGKRLRMPQAVALMRLGASAILPLSLSPAAARSQALALEGSRYQGRARSDVERVLRESRLLSRRARLGVAEFQAHAGQVLAPAGRDVPHTLVVLHPMTDAGGQAICGRLEQGLRDGVYCREPDGIWILLMACRPLDCQGVLERVLGARFESLLVGWRKIGRPEDILRTVTELDDLHLYAQPLAA